MLLLGTSGYRTFLCAKSTRPLELTVRLLSDGIKGGAPVSRHGAPGDGAEDEPAPRTGIIGGIYPRLFTPGKKRSVSSAGAPPTPDRSTDARSGVPVAVRGGGHTAGTTNTKAPSPG